VHPQPYPGLGSSPGQLEDDFVTRQQRDDETVKKTVQQHWNGRAETFDDVSHHGVHTADQRERWLDVLREWAGEDSRRALDVGCGTGVISLLLAKLGHDVAGVDVAPAMLDRARQKARRAGRAVDFFRGDAERLPFPDDSFELVTARHLVWTLPDPESALREWKRVVEPGGLVVLFEGYWDHEEPWDEYEEIHGDLPLYDGRPPGELREILAGTGLDDLAHEPLRDPTLWGREPHHDYYVVRGTVPR